MLEILPVHGIGDVRPGDDLAALIADAAPWLRDGDILVVTSKIVSKAEGRLVDVPLGGPEREAAREDALSAETARPVARRGHTRIVQTHHGFVMASAGIDASNVDRGQLVLLPKDPDGTARALRTAFRERVGVDVAVIVSDTMGRPWRVGLIDVALGAAGIDALRDYRGEVDSYGNELHITQMAVVDELASAAELVKGKCDQVPVAVVRGFRPSTDVGRSTRVDALRTGVDRPTSTARHGDGAGAGVLVRGAEHDLFSLGTAEARTAALREAATLTDPPATSVTTAPDSATVRRAVDLVRTVAARTTTFDVDGAGGCIRCRGEDPVALGVDVHRLRLALLAEGLTPAEAPHPAEDRRFGSHYEVLLRILAP